MKKLTIGMAAIVAVIMIASFQSCKSSASAKVLKFNLEKGKGYDYEMVWDMDQKIVGQDTKISLGAAFSMNVTDDDGKVKTISSTYKSFRMNMKMPQVEINVDTDKPEPATAEEVDYKLNPMALATKVFSAIKGKSFIVKIDHEGKVLSIEGFEEIVNSMVDSTGLDEEMKMRMRASLKDQFNEQSMRDQFEPVFNIFPNKAIKVGDSWEKNYSTGGRMAAKYTTTYTVKDIDGDNVSMTAKSKIEGSGELDISGTQEGNILVDSKTGLMVNGEFDQKMEAKVQGMTIGIIGKGKIKGKAN